MVISRNINDKLNDVSKIEIYKNELEIIVRPFVSSEVTDNRTGLKTTRHLALTDYVFNLKDSELKLKDIQFFYDLLTDIPRNLRSSLCGLSQEYFIKTVDLIDYLTIKETIQFKDEYNNVNMLFDIHLFYDSYINPNLIKISFPIIL